MWMALRVIQSATVKSSILGNMIEANKVNLSDENTGMIGVAPIYKTKRQAVKDSPKGTQIIQVKEVKNHD